MTTEDKSLMEEPFPQLTAIILRKVGEALGGRHWQSDVAREANRSKSQITRYLNKSRTPNLDFGKQLDRVMVDKIEDITKLLGNSGSPNAGDRRIQRAKIKLFAGLSILRELSPATKRKPIPSEREFRAGRKKKGSKKKIRI